jgi:2-polyprenyl-6-methoxyphenol hydroxylase-like FAD-dependent oxidoreductase
MTLPNNADVVVVGAGPTGLTLACTLRAAGVDVLVLDKVVEGANTSRAAVVHARTLEVLDQLNVTPRLVGEGCVVPVFTVRDRRRVLARLDFSDLPTPYPYTLMLPQSRTEAILTERFAELGGYVHRPWTVSSVDPTAIGSVVTASDATGTSQTVHARYVVGADGLNSVVRTSAGIGFSGDSYAASFVLADIELDWPLPTGEVQLFFSPAGLVVVAPLPGGRHRIVATVDQAPETPGAGLIQSLLDERGPGGAHVRDLAWSSRFGVQHRVADQFRRGSLFLAGDAAHVHSPAGGQGMNTGIQDAIDLGHTLIESVIGGAADTALDGYQERRRPIALQVVKLTDRATRLATLQGTAARAGRNLAIAIGSHVPAVRRRLTLQIAELPHTRTASNSAHSEGFRHELPNTTETPVRPSS